MAKIEDTRTDIYILGGVNGEKMIGGDGDDFFIGRIGKDILVCGKGNNYFEWWNRSRQVQDLQGNDCFINFDLYGNPDVIADKLKIAEIVGP